MLAGFVKYLPSARMDCTVPRFTVSCSRCAASRGILRFCWLSSDSVKCKGVSCVQGIECGAQNRQKRKKPWTTFNTQHRVKLIWDCRSRWICSQHYAIIQIKMLILGGASDDKRNRNSRLCYRSRRGFDG